MLIDETEAEALLREDLRNAEAETVAAQFLRWNKARGEELPGLTGRRHAERALFLEPIALSNLTQI